MHGRYHVQRGNSTQEEVQAITEKAEQENLIQIELLVCGRCAVDRGRERCKSSVKANLGIRLTSAQRASTSGLPASWPFGLPLRRRTGDSYGARPTLETVP